jgi:hypothetical protein
VRTDGPMAPDIALERQRPAQYVFSQHVAIKLAEIGKATPARNGTGASEGEGH